MHCQEGGPPRLTKSERARHSAMLREPREDPPLAVQAKKTNTCSIEDYLRSLLVERLQLSPMDINASSTYPIEEDLAYEIAMIIGANGITNGTITMASDCRTVGSIMRRFA